MDPSTVWFCHIKTRLAWDDKVCLKSLQTLSNIKGSNMNKGEIKIVPAVLESSVEAVQEKVDRLKGVSKVVGVDIVDGVFADNLTISAEDLRDVDFSELEVEVQLMTEYPIELLGALSGAGVSRVFGHVERMGSKEEFIKTAIDLVIKPGLALDLYTPVEEIDRDLWDKLDGVLLMGVKAGFSGQEFDKRVLGKIKKMRQMGFEKPIQVDGGMRPETVKKCMEAGADEFSVTSWLWKHDDLVKAVDELKEAGAVGA